MKDDRGCLPSERPSGTRSQCLHFLFSRLANSVQHTRLTDAVQAEVLHPRNRVRHELGTRRCVRDKGEVSALRVRPTADGDQRLDVPLLQLDQEETLETTIDLDRR